MDGLGSLDNIANAKLYLIEFQGYEMQTGDMLSLEYKIQIPENLEYDKTVYTNYVVYFDNIKKDETIKDKQIATKVGLSTGEGPHLSIAMRNDKQGEVQEGEVVTYTISVKNTGNTAVNNVKVTGKIPKGTIYTEINDLGGEGGIEQKYDANKIIYEETIQRLAPNEIKLVTYSVLVKEISKTEPINTIETVGNAKVENYAAEFKSNALTNKIIEGYLSLKMIMTPRNESNVKKEGTQITYYTEIVNVNNKEKTNVILTNKLPDGLTYISSSGEYDEKTKTVIWDLGTIKAKETKAIALKVKIDELSQNEASKQIDNKMTLKTSEKELTTNTITFFVRRPLLTIKQTSKTSEKVTEGDTIEYNIEVKNIGQDTVYNAKLVDYMPDNLLYMGSTYVVNGKIYTSWIGNEKAEITIPVLEPNQIADITIKAKVQELEDNIDQKETINIVQLSVDDKNEIGSNEIKHIIVRKTETNDPSVDEVEDETYKITGLAWLDTNKDGRRDNEENTLENIEVMLVNSETGKIVTDSKTGRNKIQKTNEQGIYTFSNLKPGKYLVVFNYDTENYGVTKYQANGVIDSKNSDAISMKITLNGETKLAAVANSIEITNSDVTNIDMGLIVKSKFDLKLDKTVSKIIVNDANGAKEYNYVDAKFAKVDIKDKLINGTTIIVEYRIKVTNEGEIPGYVKKIVDYIPNDMTFNSELNEEWYLGEKGNAYNASLANTLINPGETKEVIITLTKKMTNENTGTINNTAEIYEDSNDYGLQDIDSNVANKVQGEDDYSSADVVIGIKTGEVYVYVIITLISITILGIGIYFINKKVLRRI